VLLAAADREAGLRVESLGSQVVPVSIREERRAVPLGVENPRELYGASEPVVSAVHG
jgi:hypothetical protein